MQILITLAAAILSSVLSVIEIVFVGPQDDATLGIFFGSIPIILLSLILPRIWRLTSSRQYSNALNYFIYYLVAVVFAAALVLLVGASKPV